MKKTFLFLLMTACFIGCSNKKNENADLTKSNRLVLMETDQAFSTLSEQKGMKRAFIEYIDSNGVLLRPNHLPIVGANAIDFLIEQDDSDYTLKWEPHFAEAARSGELGYTYGVYELYLKSKDTTLYGSYISIWKKQKDGKWKYVLDAGIEGIGNDQ